MEDKEEGFDGGDVGNEIQNEREQQTLVSLNQPTNLHFRIGRQPQPTSKCTRFVLAVFKVTFCSLGLWEQLHFAYTTQKNIHNSVDTGACRSARTSKPVCCKAAINLTEYT